MRGTKEDYLKGIEKEKGGRKTKEVLKKDNREKENEE